jgi:hypothetical protein
MKSFNEPVIDFLAAEEAAATIGVEQWFDTYGILILKREEKRQRTGLKAIGKAACAGR